MKNENCVPQICPLCGGSYTERPAISRLDNRTEICPLCGTREALDALGVDRLEQEHIIATIDYYSTQARKDNGKTS